MRWQEKVALEIERRGSSAMNIAERASIPYTTFKRAFDDPDAWKTTVGHAIRLARQMGTTVEYLFDPNSDWPQPEAKKRISNNMPADLRAMLHEWLIRSGGDG